MFRTLVIQGLQLQTLKPDEGQSKSCPYARMKANTARKFRKRWAAEGVGSPPLVLRKYEEQRTYWKLNSQLLILKNLAKANDFADTNERWSSIATRTVAQKNS
jgi:hypothetical protein